MKKAYMAVIAMLVLSTVGLASMSDAFAQTENSKAIGQDPQYPIQDYQSLIVLKGVAVKGDIATSALFISIKDGPRPLGVEVDNGLIHRYDFLVLDGNVYKLTLSKTTYDPNTGTTITEFKADNGQLLKLVTNSQGYYGLTAGIFGDYILNMQSVSYPYYPYPQPMKGGIEPLTQSDVQTVEAVTTNARG